MQADPKAHPSGQHTCPCGHSGGQRGQPVSSGPGGATGGGGGHCKDEPISVIYEKNFNSSQNQFKHAGYKFCLFISQYCFR